MDPACNSTFGVVTSQLPIRQRQLQMEIPVKGRKQIIPLVHQILQQEEQ